MRPNVIVKFAVFCLAALLLTSCGENGGTNTHGGGNGIPVSPVVDEDNRVKRDSTPVLMLPVASGEDVRGNTTVSVDASNAAKGYIGVAYKGTNKKVRLQITKEGGDAYTYVIQNSEYDFFPLSLGNGGYTINVYENIKDNSYALAFGTQINVTLEDEFSPFLYSNQYVYFDETTKAVKKGEELSRGAYDELGVVENVYDYVINNVSYDYDKATAVSEGRITDYIPDVDDTLATGKGICFDYASLMVAMLRTQNIPTKLIFGYAGENYHAWINVYVKDVGWVNEVIRFDGETWVRMDPTFASSASSFGRNSYVGDGEHYTEMYYY